MSDRWTARKLWCLDKIVVDQEVTDLDFRIAYLVSCRMDRATGIARVRQEDVAKAVGAQRRSVQRAIERLCKLGHLEMTPATGRGNVNGYRLPLEKAPIESPFTEQSTTSESPFPSGKGRLKRHKRATQTTRKGDPPFAQSPFLLPVNLPTPRDAMLADALASLGEELGVRIGAEKARSWFGRTEVVDVAGDVLTLAAPSKFVCSRILSEFEPELVEVVAKLVPSVRRVSVIVASQGGAA
ncbi:hypothetical protein [Bradyrhizobium stylosanthis]|uniref:hypothetical protein n=1 Tax=Bradyrhizobium stylosanthis TaxID=1803665 RepID=UPI0007C539D2|nr:hypothetical protein [Bradyrhizobium stylosanthis]